MATVRLVSAYMAALAASLVADVRDLWVPLVGDVKLLYGGFKALLAPTDSNLDVPDTRYSKVTKLHGFKGDRFSIVTDLGHGLPRLWTSVRVEKPGSVRLVGRPGNGTYHHNHYVAAMNFDIVVNLTPKPGRYVVPSSVIKLVGVHKDGSPQWEITDIDPLEELLAYVVKGIDAAFAVRGIDAALSSRDGWYAVYLTGELIPDCPFCHDVVSGRDAQQELRVRIQDRIDSWFSEFTVDSEDAMTRRIKVDLDGKDDKGRPISGRVYPYRGKGKRPNRNHQAMLTWLAMDHGARERSWFWALKSSERAGSRVVDMELAKQWIGRLPYTSAIGKLAAGFSRHQESKSVMFFVNGKGEEFRPADPMIDHYGYDGGALTLPVIVACHPRNVLQGIVVAKSWARRIYRRFFRRVDVPLVRLEMSYTKDGERREMVHSLEQLKDPAVQEFIQAELTGAVVGRRLVAGYGPKPSDGAKRNGDGWYQYRRTLDGVGVITGVQFEMEDSPQGIMPHLVLDLEETRLLRDGDKLFVGGSKGTVAIVPDKDMPGGMLPDGKSRFAIAVEPMKVLGGHMDLLEQAVIRPLLAAGLDPKRLPDRTKPWDWFIPETITDLKGIVRAAEEHYGVKAAWHPQVDNTIWAFCPVYADCHTAVSGSEAEDDTLWTLLQSWLSSDSPAFRAYMAEYLNREIPGIAELLATAAQEYRVHRRSNGELWLADGPGVEAGFPLTEVVCPLQIGGGRGSNARYIDLTLDAEDGYWVAADGRKQTLLPEDAGWLVIALQGGGKEQPIDPNAQLARRLLGCQNHGIQTGSCMKEAVSYIVIPPAAQKVLFRLQVVMVGEEGQPLYAVDKILHTLNRIVRIGTIPTGRPTDLFGEGADGARRFSSRQLEPMLKELFGTRVYEVNPDTGRGSWVHDKMGAIPELLLKEAGKRLNARGSGLRVIADADVFVHPDEVEADPAWLDFCESLLKRKAKKLGWAKAEAELRRKVPGFMREGDVVVYKRPPVEPGHGHVAGRIVRGRVYESHMRPGEPRLRVNSFVLCHLMRGDRDGDLLYFDILGPDEEAVFEELRPSRLTTHYRQVSELYMRYRPEVDLSAFRDGFDFVATAMKDRPVMVDILGSGDKDLHPLRMKRKKMATLDVDGEWSGAPLRRRHVTQAATEVTIKQMARLRSSEYQSLNPLVPHEAEDLTCLKAFWRLVGEAGIEKDFLDFGLNGSLDATYSPLKMTADEIVHIFNEIPAGRTGKNNFQALLENGVLSYDKEKELEEMFTPLVDATPVIKRLEGFLAARCLAESINAKVVKGKTLKRGKKTLLHHTFRLRRVATDSLTADAYSTRLSGAGSQDLLAQLLIQIESQVK